MIELKVDNEHFLTVHQRVVTVMVLPIALWISESTDMPCTAYN